MMNGLAAIAAILRASAGLDTEQTAQLNTVWIEILAMDRLCPEQKIVEGRIVKLSGFVDGPAVADRTVRKAAVIDFPAIRRAYGFFPKQLRGFLTVFLRTGDSCGANLRQSVCHTIEAADTKGEAPSAGGIALGGLYRQSSICVARPALVVRRPSPRSALAAPIASEVRQDAVGQIAARQGHWPAAVRAWPAPHRFAAGRINSRVSSVYTLRTLRSEPYSYARLKFKRMFETDASRKNGVLVIFTGQ